ncbi:MAG: ABC transporter ATP-binding protein [gamma proteobacterium symbiont of Taylorina sp.]|nr:ABC transporter ATP-binding protein [gamma proteobacterium symbiont of Taylorina sp.]
MPIVCNISFSIAPGQITSLIGESGSGKTTVSLATMGYSRPNCKISKGKVILQDEDLLNLDSSQIQQKRGSDIAYIAQSAAAAFNRALTIGAQVTEVAVLRGLMTRQQADLRAVSLYNQLGLPNPETIGRLYPHQVSGGQLQRLMAAMAMMCHPKLLIMDEPTTALDVTTQIEVLQAFKRLIREQKVAAIYVSHDLAVVVQMADDILVLKDGRMVELQSTQNILDNPCQEYTRMLMDAVPQLQLPHISHQPLTAAAAAAADKLTPDPVEKCRLENTVRKEANSDVLLTLSNVTAAYGSNTSTVLKDISLKVNLGETIGIIGESGSGKTTLGRVISGLMVPSNGQIEFQGRVLNNTCKQRSREDLRQIQFVFQMAETALNPRHRIRQILGRPLEFYLGMTGRAAEERIVELLDLVELSAEFIDRFPRELSGGQLQRINFARALAAEPKLIICDEITSALDTLVSKAIIELLINLKNRLGIAYVFISHDLSTVAKLADSLAVMRHGEIVEFNKTGNVLTPPHHEYTELLLDSIPKLRTGWLEEVSGLVYNPV